jgi:hypothetical protein
LSLQVFFVPFSSVKQIKEREGTKKKGRRKRRRTCCMRLRSRISLFSVRNLSILAFVSSTSTS